MRRFINWVSIHTEHGSGSWARQPSLGSWCTN